MIGFIMVFSVNAVVNQKYYNTINGLLLIAFSWHRCNLFFHSLIGKV